MTSWFVVLFLGEENTIEPPELAIPHVSGLCRDHHRIVTSNLAWIKLEDGVFAWYDRNVPDDHWAVDGWIKLGPLDPQPGERTKSRKPRKRFKGEARRNRATISIKVPQDEREDGAGIYQDALELAEVKLGYGESPRPAYYTITQCLQMVALGNID